jgi:DNA processing protein
MTLPIKLFIALTFAKKMVQDDFIRILNDGPEKDLFDERFSQYTYIHKEEIAKIETYCDQHNVSIITIADKAYSKQLRQINDPPLVLYAKGDVSLLNQDSSIAIVGTRKATMYGKRVAEEYAQKLSLNNIVVVSGLALGIDASAHKGALQGGKTIAVLGTGIEKIYPISNKKLYKDIYEKGLVVTEFSPDYPVSRSNFPRRNRIIAGLSKGVLVVESKEWGGSLITAELALQYDRDVFAIPGRMTDEQSKGANRLIQQGAKLVLSVDDIVDEMNWLISPKKVKVEMEFKLNEEERHVFDSLSMEPIHMDSICEKTGYSAPKVMTILSFLELQGAAKQMPGKLYIKG